ncbi:MAG: hypothetical protein PHO00_08415 [bacterium]|nr:hypothetical protein [bacterium]
MPENNLKMVMIVYYEAMDMEITEVLRKCSMTCYTKVGGVLGRGELSDPKHGNDIWPGKNNVIYVACPSRTAESIIGCVEILRKKHGKEGIKAFVWTLESMT